MIALVSLSGPGIVAVSSSFLEGIIKVLAVAGGGALGWLAIGFLVRDVGRWLAAKDVPRSMLLTVRSLGAVTAGWVVWHMVFGPGGSGLFSGGAGGDGKGSASENGQATIPAGPSVPSPSSSDENKLLPIVMLGGKRVGDDGAFYLVPGDKMPRTLSTVKQIIKETRQRIGLRGIEILVYDDSVDQAHVAVRELADWAERQNLTVTISFPKGEAP
jgi:hypothetical protein